jgi:hypothetical protein
MEARPQEIIRLFKELEIVFGKLEKSQIVYLKYVKSAVYISKKIKVLERLAKKEGGRNV